MCNYNNKVRNTNKHTKEVKRDKNINMQGVSKNCSELSKC